MAQYKTGLVSVTNGSPTVTGAGTLWVGEVSVGDIFTIVGSNAWYEVGAVDSNTQVTLSSNYAGTTASDASYAISRDFTANYGLPYPQKGDIETASLIKRAFQDIDSKLVLTSSNGDVTVTGDLIVEGSTISLDNATVQTFTWGDNDKAIFGAGSDLQIYSDGTTGHIDGSVILDDGTANGVAYLNGSKAITTGSALNYASGTGVGNLLEVTGGSTGVNGQLNIQGTDGANTSFVSLLSGLEPTNLPSLFFSNGLRFATATNKTASGYSEQMRLTSTGLGIGTSDPAYKLDVRGAGLVGNFVGSTYGQIQVQATGTNQNVYLTGNPNGTGKVIFQYGATDVMQYDSSGNLGLGVAPSASWSGTYAKAFQLGNKGASISGFTSSLSALPYVNIGNNSYYASDTNWKYYSANGAALYQQAEKEHRWFVSSGSPVLDGTISFTQAMTLTADGNLGVGTTNPQSRIDVAGTTSTTGFVRWTDSVNATGFLGVDSVSPFINSNNGILRFGTSLSNALTERMRIDSSGNITSTTSEAYLYFTSNYNVGSNTRAAIRTVGAGGGSGYGGDLRFSTRKPDNNWNNDAVVIDSSGNLLVGKTSTSLSIVGGMIYNNGRVFSTLSTNNGTDTFTLYSTGASAYRFYVLDTGTVYATNTTISSISDQRYKENIRDLDVGLDAVMQLRPRKFDWKEGKGQDTKDCRGFIAQEFEQVFPDLIDEWKDPAPEGEEPYKSVRQDLMPVLVKAIQEQQEIIDSLKARLDAANL